MFIWTRLLIFAAQQLKMVQSLTLIQAQEYSVEATSTSFFFLKKGIKKTKQATKKKILPNIAQKFPMLEIINPTADMINKIQPKRLIWLFFMT